MPSGNPQPANPQERIFTPANVVTLIRICLVPVFVVVLVSPWPDWFRFTAVTNEFKRYIAAGIFILISCTDWLDGYLARSRGEVTDFGKFLDPIADKILVVAALLALIELGALPSWVALIIIAREFIVCAVRMVAASKGEVIAASWYGKFKTVFQMIAIVLFTLKDGYMQGSFNAAISDSLWLISWAVMIIALALTVISMLDYIAKARHLIGLGKLSFSKSSKTNSKAERSSETESESDNSDIATPSSEELFNLSSEVLRAAQSKNLKLATAESLTGGLIAANLTAVPGSSATVLGGIISYDPAVKHEELDVSEQIINNDGVVSEACAKAMAHGAQQHLHADIAVAVTGIAGPGGEEPGKPVGTVWLGLSMSGSTTARVFCFQGDRDAVRLKTVYTALQMLLSACEKHT